MAVPALQAPRGHVIPWNFIPFSGCQGAELVPCNPNIISHFVLPNLTCMYMGKTSDKTICCDVSPCQSFPFLPVHGLSRWDLSAVGVYDMPTSEQMVQVSFVPDRQLVGWHFTSNWASKLSPPGVFPREFLQPV